MKQLIYSLLLAAALGLPAYSQSQALDGALEGSIESPDGGRIANATVRAVNQGTNLTREAMTGSDGQYQLNLLPPGQYTVTVEQKGFNKSTRNGVVLRAGQTVTLDFKLVVGDVATIVEVTEEIPVIEVGSTVRANTYEERVVRNLPTAGRSLMDFFVVQPGVNAPVISTGGSGTGTASTSYGGLGFRQMNVDGVSNNIQGGARNLVISQDAVAEFQTVTNFTAEFGRVAGGLQNAFTRSGTNEWHGSGFLFARNKALSKAPFFIQAGRGKPDFFRYNYGGTIGGALKKDKIFVFGSYERWAQDNPVISTFPVATAQRLGVAPENYGDWITAFRAHTLTAKLDWQLNEKNRLSSRYNYYFDRESPLGGGNNTREQAARFDEEPNSVTSQLVTTLGPNKLNEFRFHFANRPIRNPVLDPARPNINIQGVGTFNGNRDGNFSSLEQGFQIINNFTWTKGRHNLKAGIDLLPVSFRERTRDLNGQFTFSGLAAVAGVRPAVPALDQFLFTEQRLVDPATGRPYTYTQFVQAIGQEFFEARVINQGYFIQDDIRVNSRLKVNAGLRYELFTRPEGNAGNPNVAGSGKIPQDYNNWAPRVGVTFDPAGDGKTVVRGGYGIYYNTTVAQTFNTFLRGDGVSVFSVNVTPTQAGAPEFRRDRAPSLNLGLDRALVSDIRVFNESFDDPMVHSLFASFERQILSNTSVSLTYSGVFGRDLPYSLIDNLRPDGTLPDGRRRWARTNRPIPQVGNVFRAVSDGYQDYNGLILVVTRRFSRGLMFQAGYHYSKTEGVAYTNSPGAFTGFGITNSPADPQDARVDVGPGDWDMRHRFTLTGVWEPRIAALRGAADAILNGWQVAPRIITNTGFAFSATTGRDDNNDGVQNDRPVGQGYNAFYLPEQFALDLRLTRNFRVGELGRVELIGEAFNLTNYRNVTNVQRVWGINTTPNANFNTATSAEISRQFQLAIRYSF